MTHTERTNELLRPARHPLDYAYECGRRNAIALDLAKKLDAVMEIVDKLPDDLYVYRTLGGETKVQVKDGSVKSVIRAISEEI